MRRHLISFVVLALVALSCGGEAGTSTTSAVTTTAAPAATTTTTEPAPMAFTSDDGVVTVEVPRDVLDADPGITITALDPGDEPALDLPFVPVWLYSFGPDGQSFDGSVTVTFEIPLADLGDVGDDQTPIVSLVSTTADGEGWEMLDGHRVSRTDDTVRVSAETTHFSRVAALSEQVFVETKLVEVTDTFARDLGIDWRGLDPATPVIASRYLWSNGVLLDPPEIGGATFEDRSTSLAGDVIGTSFAFDTPSSILGLDGDLVIHLLLRATEDTSGRTGLTSAPRVLTTSQDQATITVTRPLTLDVRPTIAEGGDIILELQVDHPGGDVFIPGEDFGGGLSGMLGALSREIDGLLAGLIRDDDSDGRVSPGDTMYPPVVTTADGGKTTFMIPLFGMGDYVPFFIDTRGLDTTVRLPDGATTVLGGLEALREQGVTDDRVSIPWLGDLPLLGRVFQSESATSEKAELVILLRPTVIIQE